MKVSIFGLGLIVGVTVAAMHVMWAMLVAMNWAQPLLDFIFRLHFLSPPFHVGAFDIGTAAELIAVTGGIGFMAGAIFGVVWNAAQGRLIRT